MKTLTNHFLFLIINIYSFSFCNSIIRGTVIEFDGGKPIQDVNIFINSQKIGTTTNADGIFELRLREEESYLINVSHIAYNSKIIKTISGQNVNIPLEKIFLKFDDIVVTSMKCDYQLSDIPIYSEVISNNDINESGSISVSDLLKQHSGISKKYNSHGSFDYNLLGLDSKYILILKNGKPIPGKFQDRIDLDQIMLSNVDRVEIIKGPGSSLYGSDAMGGVINIITHAIPTETQINLRIRKSIFDRVDDNKKLPQSTGNLISFGIFKRLNDFHLGSNVLFQELLNQAEITPLGKDEISKINFDGEVYWKPSKGINQLGFLFDNFNQQDEGRQLLSTGIQLSSNNTNINRTTLTINHLINFPNGLNFNHSLSKAFYERIYNQTGVDQTFYMYNKAREIILDYDGSIQYTHKRNSFLLGFDIIEPTFSNQRLVDTSHVINKRGFFIQNEYSKEDNYKIVFGLRNDQYQDLNQISPRAAFLYQLGPKYKMRLNIGKGFRAPSILETFIDFHNIDQDYMVQGNSNLRPEKSLGSSMNIEFSNKNNIRINGLLYYNSFIDKIFSDSVNTIGSSTVFSYKNISNATYRGIEFFVDYIHSNAYSGKFNINLRENIDGLGDMLPNTIPFSTNTELNMLFNLLKLKIRFSHSFNQRNQTNSSFNLFDLLFQKKVYNILNVNFGVKNLGNYVNKVVGPFKGRSIYVEISNQR